jgi:Flp pilus assembly pilin Flp
MKPDRLKKAALLPKALVRRSLRSAFSRNQSGATIVEFGLLALPFFAIIGAILETAFYFLSSQVLDSAVDTSVRYIRTGQAQEVNLTAQGFRDTICDGLFNLFHCDQLRIIVDTASDFTSVSFSSPLEEDPDGELIWTDTEVYTPGSGSEIVTVRVYYKWPTILDLLGFNLANAGDGYRLMSSVRVFKNEPFS